VDIVVSKGFTGPIWIVLDPEGKDMPQVNGRYQVVIPADGVLRVRSFRPFEQWHQMSARYADGTSLPEADGGKPAGPDVVALRGGHSVVAGGNDIRWIAYFVGTAKQYKERPDMELPPGLGR
jgi:hypothetical protein